jgi:cell division protein FtsW
VLRRLDLLLCGITVVLTFFGLAMIASVSVFESYQLTQRLVADGLRSEPSNSFYLIRSSMHAIVGLGCMCITTLIPYRTWERLALPLFGATLLLLLAVFLPGIGADYGTSYSWLRIGGFSLQPVEFFKIAFIFYMAIWLQKREQLVSTFHDGFLPFATLLVISTFLVAVQPDFGSFLILSGIAITMFFIAGGNMIHMILGGAIAGVLGLPIILNKGYIRNRFRAFLSPDDPAISESIGFQIKQSLIAIGSGGFFGVGYGKSIQKFGYLPEVQADMIFAAMSEELGFMRLLIILGMYGIFVWRGFHIAQNAPDRFGFLVATGITTWIGLQTVINISVNVALFPITGLTLPFISYGGSSLLALLSAVGILLNISMSSTEEASRERRTRSRPRMTW